MSENLPISNEQPASVESSTTKVSFGRFSKIIGFSVIIGVLALAGYTLFLKEKPEESKVITGF